MIQQVLANGTRFYQGRNDDAGNAGARCFELFGIGSRCFIGYFRRGFVIKEPAMFIVTGLRGIRLLEQTALGKSPSDRTGGLVCYGWILRKLPQIRACWPFHLPLPLIESPHNIPTITRQP